MKGRGSRQEHGFSKKSSAAENQFLVHLHDQHVLQVEALEKYPKNADETDENAKDELQEEVFLEEHKLWIQVKQQLSESYGASNYFHGAIGGKYFDRKKAPQKVKGKLSVNGDALRKKLKSALEQLTYDSNAHKTCFYFLGSTTLVYGKYVLHAGILIVRNTMENVKRKIED